MRKKKGSALENSTNPSNDTAYRDQTNYAAGFGASAGGAGAFVAGVGEVDIAGVTAAGAALQPLVQPVVTIDEPQVLQPVVQVLHGAGVEHVLQLGAGAEQQRVR